MFSELHALIRLVLTVPLSNAIEERSFSAVNQVLSKKYTDPSPSEPLHCFECPQGSLRYFRSKYRV